MMVIIIIIINVNLFKIPILQFLRVYGRWRVNGCGRYLQAPTPMPLRHWIGGWMTPNGFKRDGTRESPAIAGAQILIFQSESHISD